MFDFLLNRGNDLTSYFWPHAFFFKKNFWQFKELPLWQNFIFCGSPYIADPQNLFFYPPNWLFLILPIDFTFLFLFMFHFILAFYFTFKTAKEHFKTSSVSSFLTVLVFILSPVIFSHLEAGHYSMIITVCWLPALFYLILKFLKNPTARTAFLLSLIFWFIFSNYINIFYFSFLFFVSFLIYRIFTLRVKRKRNREEVTTRVLDFARTIRTKNFFMNFMTLILAFLLFSSFQILNQLRFAPFSNRSLLTFSDVAIPLWSFRDFSQSFLFPYLKGVGSFSTERLLFPGLLVWMLSFLGFLNYKKKEKYFFLAFFIFSLLFSLGARIPFFVLFYKFLPGIRWMRVTTRVWIIPMLLLALMAGVGFEFLRKKLKGKWLFLIAFLSVFELALVDFLIFQKPIPKSSSAMGKIYQFLEKDKSFFRAYCTTGCFSPKEIVKADLQMLGGNNPVQLASYVSFLEKAGGYSYKKYIPVLPPYEVFDSKPQPNPEFLGLLNTKYVVSPYPLEDKSFLLRKQFGELGLYENLKNLPRAFVETGAGSRVEAKISFYSPNKIKIEIPEGGEGELTLTEIFYPGWQAFDQAGRELEIKPAYEILRQAKVDSSINQVIFVYSSFLHIF